MFDINLYLKNNGEKIFNDNINDCKYAIKCQKNTGNIYFCSRRTKEGKIIDEIVLKHYHNSETPYLEYSFAIDKEESFLQETNIRIPNYIFLDNSNMVVVSRFIKDSISLEKILLSKRLIYNNNVNINLFRLAGKWLAHFHKITQSDSLLTINNDNFTNDLREKWLLNFQGHEPLKSKFIKISKQIFSNGHRTIIPSLMHREYGPGNILIDGKNLYGIDFGNRELAFPYDDITYFIIACATLNYLPKHLLYKKLSLFDNEINEFIYGYLDHYPFTNIDPLSDKLFILFLWKNLIRRISGKLSKVKRLPPPYNYFGKFYVTNLYNTLESKLLSRF